jgi:midasin (ATPase involved in ribosome maturation)
MTESGKRSRKSAASSESRSAAPDWARVIRALASSSIDRIFLFGPPGVGKTWCAYHHGRIGNGVYAVTLTPETPASELRGNYMPRGGELIWVDGPVVRAMRDGVRLVLNEIQHAADDVFRFLHPILEQPATARITLPTSETVCPAPGFSVVATDNSPPEDLPPAHCAGVPGSSASRSSRRPPGTLLVWKFGNREASPRFG